MKTNLLLYLVGFLTIMTISSVVLYWYITREDSVCKDYREKMMVSRSNIRIFFDCVLVNVVITLITGLVVYIVYKYNCKNASETKQYYYEHLFTPSE